MYKYITLIFSFVIVVDDDFNFKINILVFHEIVYLQKNL